MKNYGIGYITSLELCQNWKGDSMWDHKSIDAYKLNMYCVCLRCKKWHEDGPVKSCDHYPDEYTIPPKIWNAKDGHCDFFEPKKRHAQ